MRNKLAGLALVGAITLSPMIANAQTTTTPTATTEMATMPKMELMGTKLVPKACGSATIDPSGTGKWKIHVEARGLPQPSTLKGKPVRSVYLLWVIADAHMKNMAVITMKAGAKPGVYVADATVSLAAVHGLSITADLKAGQKMPTMPMVTVLETAMAK